MGNIETVNIVLGFLAGANLTLCAVLFFQEKRTSWDEAYAFQALLGFLVPLITLLFTAT